ARMAGSCTSNGCSEGLLEEDRASAMRGLPAVFQAGDQPVGHISFAHALLDRFDVVSNTTRFPGHRFDVEHGVGGARVGVARLADTARIDNQTFIAERNGFTIHRGNSFTFTLIAELFEGHWGMGVADQAELGLEMREVERSVEWVEDIFPDRLAR